MIPTQVKSIRPGVTSSEGNDIANSFGVATIPKGLLLLFIFHM